MKAALVLFVVVVVAGLVDCTPSLRARLADLRRVKLSQHIRSGEVGTGSGEVGAGSEDVGSSGWNETRHEPPEYYFWNEVCSLIAKCITAEMISAEMNLPPREGVLGSACPVVQDLTEQLGRLIKEEDDEHIVIIDYFFNLAQCANLEAERENVAFWHWVKYGTYESAFQVAGQPLFDECELVFGSVHHQMDMLDTEIQKIEQGADDKSRAFAIAKVLRQLLQYAKNK